MNVVQLSFRDNPAHTCARVLKSAGCSPENTLVISPTQRFKSALASSLMEEWGLDDLRAPPILSSEELVDSMNAGLGLESANEAQRYSMFYEACSTIEGIGELFTENFLLTFSSFRGVAQRTLQAFDELNAGEIDLHNVRFSQHPYRLFERHFEIFRNLYERFFEVQQEKRVYVRSFLTRLLRGEYMDRFFNRYSTVLFLLPVSLTAFEKRMYARIEDKLSVIFQDAQDYDFSIILDFKGASSLPPRRYPEVTFLELPSRTHQLMLSLSIIQRELEMGVPPQEIAVLNADSFFCNMFFDSLTSACIPVNYSQGLEVKKSPLYALLRLAARFFDNSLDSDVFLQIIAHPLFAEACRLNGRGLYRMIKERVYQERMFRLSSLKSALLKGEPKVEEGFSLLYRLYHAPSFEAVHESLRDFVSRISEGKTYEFFAVRDILLNTAVELTDLTTGVRERPFEILLQIIKNRRYPLKGIYGRGIQILGLLETRGILFNKLIVPTFNEGYFPVREGEDILFNLQVRKSLGLPTLLDREQLQFYYVKRLVDSSNSAWFLSLQDKRGEMDVRSRYSYYFSRHPYVYSSDLQFSDKHISGLVAAEPSSAEMRLNGIMPEKTSVLENKWGKLPYTLSVIAEQGRDGRREVTQPALGSPVTEFSRLDIDRIKRCETQYYIARALGVREEETLDHEIELHVIGQKVHALFNELYVEPSLDAGTCLARFDELFKKYLKEGLFFTAEEVLIKKLLKSNLTRVVRRDLERFTKGYRICGEFMEKELSALLTRSGSTFTLKGRIDRIDRTPSGNYEIIDYKTGRLPGKKSHFAEGGFAQIQLGFYGLLFKFNYPEVKIGALSYYDLSGKKDIETVVEEGHVQGYLKEFEDHLGELLETFSMKGRFDLTDEYEHCLYCPYYNICRVFEE